MLKDGKYYGLSLKNMLMFSYSLIIGTGCVGLGRSTLSLLFWPYRREGRGEICQIFRFTEAFAFYKEILNFFVTLTAK